MFVPFLRLVPLSPLSSASPPSELRRKPLLPESSTPASFWRPGHEAYQTDPLPNAVYSASCGICPSFIQFQISFAPRRPCSLETLRPADARSHRFHPPISFLPVSASVKPPRKYPQDTRRGTYLRSKLFEGLKVYSELKWLRSSSKRPRRSSPFFCARNRLHSLRYLP